MEYVAVFEEQLALTSVDLKKNIESIDDVLENIMLVKDLGLKPMLATWFNKNEAQHKLAKRAGIPLLTEDNFYRNISGESE